LSVSQNDIKIVINIAGLPDAAVFKAGHIEIAQSKKTAAIPAGIEYSGDTLRGR